MVIVKALIGDNFSGVSLVRATSSCDDEEFVNAANDVSLRFSDTNSFRPGATPFRRKKIGKKLLTG